MSRVMRSGEVIELIGSTAVEAMRVMSVIVDAHSQLTRVTERMRAALPTIDPTSEAGKRAERLALALTRSQMNLTQACAFMPDEFWFEYVDGSALGLEEVARKLAQPAAAVAVAVPA